MQLLQDNYIMKVNSLTNYFPFILTSVNLQKYPSYRAISCFLFSLFIYGREIKIS